MVLASVLGNLWDWVAGVFTRIGDVSPYWLVVALALKTCESALLGLTWRNILRAAYPKGGLTFKTAWGASQGGTAINALAPAQAGTAAMLGIFRTSVRGASVAGVTTAAFVQASFFLVLSVLMLIGVAVSRPHTVSKGSPADESGNFFSDHPLLIPLIVVVLIVVFVFVWPRIKPWLANEWRKAKKGAAIFSDWRLYARDVAAPSAASYVCRIGVNIVFMAAFHLPVTAFTVFLVASSHMLSGIFAITPGGVGQTQALDVATLSQYASTKSVAAFSITQDSILTIWNVLLGIGVMLWAFGWHQVRDLFSKSFHKHAHEPAAS
ncbi:MAG: hypothetical protein E6G15_11310 [Actinobacteria bacterium]|nr:MAG: hypothetical protein E6G15_11310 [Actinomycetota bacterium]